MRTITFLTIFFICVTRIFSQGFYNDDELLIDKKSIARLNITSVKATSDYPDSNFHSLSNFVFEYDFDDDGNIIRRKYWHSNPWVFKQGESKYLAISLVVDSAYFVPEFKEFTYKCIRQSQRIKFNQHKKRSRRFIRQTFNQLGLQPLSQNEECWTIGSVVDFVVDTIVFRREVRIPQFLLQPGDSLSNVNDTIMAFTKLFGVMHNPKKFYQAENGTIKIDCIDEKTNLAWRTYYIDSLGLIYKQCQNNYTILYYYNTHNLNTFTEEYLNGNRINLIKYEYNYGSR